MVDSLRARLRSEFRWSKLRWTIQILSLILFLFLYINTRRDGLQPEITNFFLRLDPLTSLANLLASRSIVTATLLALITIGLTLVFGRAWCGWLCPLGTILDLFPLKRFRILQKPPHTNWRKVKFILLLVILFAAFLGNLSLLIFDPITLLIRGFTAGLWPTLDRLLLFLEEGAYQIPLLRNPVVFLDGFIRPMIFPYQLIPMRWALLYVGFLIGVVLANLFSERFWCRYLCPFGALLGLISKVAIFRRVVQSTCGGCELCVGDCPMDVIRPDQGFSSDPAECTVCMECLDGCPQDSVSFQPVFQVGTWETYDPSRREALATFGAATAGVFLVRVALTPKPSSPYQIHPPGAYENALLSKCIRCGQCMRICPTGALQPALQESGVEGIWTPIVIPRLGYCDYSCNACGQQCPVEAIPQLELEAKRQTVIGKAVIDRDRCLAWKEESECIVCEEMCPLPGKAIWLEIESAPAGGANPIQKPHVSLDECIGCGICEYKCPVTGQAAIRVQSIESTARIKYSASP